VRFLPLLSFSALFARVQLSPFPRVMHASVVFSRLDDEFFASCCLFTCLGTKMRVPQQKKRKKNFACHTHAPLFSLQVLAREEWDLRNKRESAATSRIPLSKGKERERENCRYYTASARQRSA